MRQISPFYFNIILQKGAVTKVNICIVGRDDLGTPCGVICNKLIIYDDKYANIITQTEHRVVAHYII